LAGVPKNDGGHIRRAQNGAHGVAVRFALQCRKQHPTRLVVFQHELHEMIAQAAFAVVEDNRFIGLSLELRHRWQWCGVRNNCPIVADRSEIRPLDRGTIHNNHFPNKPYVNRNPGLWLTPTIAWLRHFA
jgi:hypothetical protein